MYLFFLLFFREEEFLRLNTSFLRLGRKKSIQNCIFFQKDLRMLFFSITFAAVKVFFLLPKEINSVNFETPLQGCSGAFLFYV